MSNIISPTILNLNKNYAEKYNIFNQYLINLFQISQHGYPYPVFQNNYNIIYHQNTEKFLKINGSKNFILSNINSLALKSDLNSNFDYNKIIKDNLSFISTNSKYLNKFPTIQKYKFFNINNNINANNNIHNSINKIEINFDDNKDRNKSNDIILYNKFNMKEIDNINATTNINEMKKSNILDKNDPNISKSSHKIKFNSHNILTESSQSQYRQDYYIKQFKVQYSIWLRNTLNKMISSIMLKVKLGYKKFIKFYPLNSLHFTANPKYKDNKIFLNLKIKDILIIGIDSNKNSNQKKNKENIEFIEKLGEKEEKMKELIQFLNITMEESVSIFYKSEQFLNFKNSTQARINDNKFYNEKKFSLLENNGFIFLIKNYNGNIKA